MGLPGVVLRASARSFLTLLASAAFACGSSQLARGQSRPHAARIHGERPALHAAPAIAAVEAVQPAVEIAAQPAPADPQPFQDPSGHALSAFHTALRRAAAGQGQARIVFYGASHVASDLFTGVLRQRLQRRFGEAGPGFVVPGKPWPYYRHAGLTMEDSRGLKAYRIRARAPEDGIYGLAGVALDARIGKPSLASMSTRGNGGLSGFFSQAELYYLKQPRGGRVQLFVDGVRAKRIDTHAERVAPGYAALSLPDGPHRIELRMAGEGPVRLFGVALERDVPGVILDTLGIPGARVRDQLFWDDAVYREHLARRRPDLLVLAYGTNESGDDDVPMEAYESKLRRVLQRTREVAASASCLLIGPSDRPLRNDDGSFTDRLLTEQIIAVQRRVSAELGCAFFDLRQFMGGPMSMLSWVAAVPPLGTTDYVHFTMLGYERLADSLHTALMQGFEATLPPPDPPEPSPAIAATPEAPVAPADAQELPRAAR